MSYTLRLKRRLLADEDSSGAAMKDVTSTSFGYVIAFLLPGLVGLYGLGCWSETIHGLLQPAFSATATVGPSLILLLGALAIGLCIGALRCFLFEKACCRKHQFPEDMFKQLCKENRLTSFRAVVDEHYRYHQFYGGCFVALIVLYVGWIWRSYSVLDSEVVLLTIGFISLEVLLFVTAVDAYKKYIDRGKTIVKGDEAVQAAKA